MIRKLPRELNCISTIIRLKLHCMYRYIGTSEFIAQTFLLLTSEIFLGLETLLSFNYFLNSN